MTLTQPARWGRDQGRTFGMNRAPTRPGALRQGLLPGRVVPEEGRWTRPVYAGWTQGGRSGWWHVTIRAAVVRSTGGG